MAQSEVKKKIKYVSVHVVLNIIFATFMSKNIKKFGYIHMFFAFFLVRVIINFIIIRTRKNAKNILLPMLFSNNTNHQH